MALILTGCGTGLAMAEDQPISAAPIHLSHTAADNAGLSTTIARQGTLKAVLQVVTRVMPNETRVVHIHPAGSGKVLDVPARPGMRVREGDVLVRYQDHSLHVAYQQKAELKAALEAAQAAVAEAQASYSRGRQLAGQSLSAGEVHRRAAVLAEAEANLRARQTDVSTLRHRFEQEFRSVSEEITGDEISSLVAPVNGMVERVDTAVASDIFPALDVATVADLSSVWLVSDVSPDAAANLRIGNPQMTMLGKTQLRSRIDSINGEADPRTGLVRVISHIANPDGRLIPGSVLDATLETQEAAQGIVVPSEAVVSINGQHIVFVQQEVESYRPVPVTVALDNGSETVLSSGLKGGESVITHGTFTLKSIILLAGMSDDD
ncbi:efflux RND transporter periplasmic adaptor subunit [Acetobacter conturbans]|uniref:Efflux RND transporter periplasmic adaptor subunit n=1 Tax=Acetobacter conturbans TaxID=1737472 RepID=A0ABX0JYM0_9PROT|nr:efflux RND transporter periplasmic adaptor subunit [Acetobacter conturbans]NHN88607.1 efflux RND transporter periplasmic adaptor subunit [Acetobacter conturbans]